MDLWLFIVLLSTVPSLHAHSNGAPYYACGDLMVQHGGNSQAKNNGYFILSDAVNDYTPGHEYLVELRGQLQAFKGFFIQARAENNRVSTASIVGVWTPLNTSFAKTVRCNKVDGDTVTHSSPVNKKSQFFMWRAPNTTVGRIHFMYSVVQAFSTFFDALNATEEKPISSVAPPTRPPLSVVFPNSYRQPEDCESYKCDFYVEWRNNDRFVDFRMEGKSNGWIVLGLSGDNTSLNSVGRVFSDILMCQAEPTGNVTNVKDLFLAGGSTTPMFDSSVNGTEYTSGRMVNDRIYCNFSRVGFVLAGQENQDVSFSDNNFLFFLAGNDTGKAGDIPKDFDISDNVKFSVALNLEMPELGPVVFKGSPDTLPGKGSFPSRSCNPDDCDFYFRWGVNPGNPNYLTLYINANISRGWAAIGVSTNRRMGGDEIDDVFGCVIIDTNGTITVEAIDTYNIAGGGRRNIGDGDSDGIVLHKGSVVDGRMKCTFSRVVFVLPENEGIDLNLNNSYYLLIGTGESSGIYGNFPKHQHNPQISTSKINLVTEASIDFDYSKVPLIKTHGIVMIVAWPVLGFLGILMANHMKPALPNGGWFSLHKIFMISSLCLTCCAFVMIFVAFRNAPTKGLITLHDVSIYTVEADTR